MIRSFGTAALGLGLMTVAAMAQDMMRHLDLSSPDMVSAEMTRGDVEAALATATTAAPADFTGKRLSGLDLSALDLSNTIFRAARLNKTKLAGANLGADMRNQSMGLMRAVLKSANLERLNARGADLSRVDLEFASLKGADLTGASLKRAQLGGADLTGVTVIDTDFDGADLASVKLIAPIGLDQAKNFDKTKNSDRLIR